MCEKIDNTKKEENKQFKSRQLRIYVCEQIAETLEEKKKIRYFH